MSGYAAVDALSEIADSFIRQAKRLANLSHDPPCTVSPDRRDSRYPVAAVYLCQILTDIVSMTRFKVDIDVGPFAAIDGQKAVEVQVMLKPVDAREAET